MRKLGIIAGEGQLPRRVADAYDKTGDAVFFVAFHGITDPQCINEVEHVWVRLGQWQDTVDKMLSAGVQDVVMVGPIKRPALSSLALDRRAAKILARAGLGVLGDDGLLSHLISEIEKDGFKVVGIDSILGNVLASEGLIAGSSIDKIAKSDIDRGLSVLKCLGPADVGQSVVIQEGLVLAVEAIEGTDAMLIRAGKLAREGRGPILVKVRKPDQEQRADLPTIGPDTVKKAASYGFRGIAVEAEGTLLIDKDKIREIGEAAGIFIIGIKL